jgi:hypothetical protein
LPVLEIGPAELQPDADQIGMTGENGDQAGDRLIRPAGLQRGKRTQKGRVDGLCLCGGLRRRRGGKGREANAEA